MKKTLLVLAIAGLALAGCDQQSSSTQEQTDAAAVQAQQTDVVDTAGVEQAETKAAAEQEVYVDAAHNAQNALDWNGTYQGTLPCADCDGIKVTLTLNTDGTYSLTEKYLGKENGEFSSNGNFNWNAAGNTISVPSDDGAFAQYFVAENQLFRLDQEGQRITGDLAEQYVLSKQ
ncbi:copper resistance protein NlpE [Photobacterium atrarenae]|uniref:Copper resistance protein NlpE N-terminal domain-containing protein n=1 Tax=Photobacterium atrarenae TaxID=865757 RepID=A0ABY5GJH9_9GAMM|nr:copper resistance protein NlpE [Photobacterium atrarenae]UTV29465.1 copper resistance protein NlpE N-terminal domain-containing protein [Photobacterium atrarenae]